MVTHHDRHEALSILFGTFVNEYPSACLSTKQIHREEDVLIAIFRFRQTDPNKQTTSAAPVCSEAAKTPTATSFLCRG